MKLPVPCRWRCGACGAEMAFVWQTRKEDQPLTIYCNAMLCAQKNVPIEVEINK